MINHGQPNQYSSAAEKILESMCRFVKNKTKKGTESSSSP